VPQAINAGDAMFTLAHMALNPLQVTHPAEVVLKAHELLENACLALTQGQYLDIAYETRSDLTLEAYWPMVGGKTAALLTTCTELGALTARVSPERQQAFHELGRYLGLAFQVQDDLLGIWGDAAVTGKSNESDLVAGKNSLPVLYGLSQDGAFAARWRAGPIQAEEVAEVAAALAAEGALDYTRSTADELTAKALQSLEMADPQGEGGEALVALANRLLKREV
jgi:geranylgeranyl diphosphate synthase type I